MPNRPYGNLESLVPKKQKNKQNYVTEDEGSELSESESDETPKKKKPKT